MSTTTRREESVECLWNFDLTANAVIEISLLIPWRHISALSNVRFAPFARRQSLGSSVLIAAVNLSGVRYGRPRC